MAREFYAHGTRTGVAGSRGTSVVIVYGLVHSNNRHPITHKLSVALGDPRVGGTRSEPELLELR